MQNNNFLIPKNFKIDDLSIFERQDVKNDYIKLLNIMMDLKRKSDILFQYPNTLGYSPSYQMLCDIKQQQDIIIQLLMNKK
jgi:hypothetical protein